MEHLIITLLHNDQIVESLSPFCLHLFDFVTPFLRTLKTLHWLPSIPYEKSKVRSFLVS